MQKSCFACKKCGNDSYKVIETRVTGTHVRRRCKCFSCGHRFTTYEISEENYEQFKLFTCAQTDIQLKAVQLLEIVKSFTSDLTQIFPKDK